MNPKIDPKSVLAAAIAAFGFVLPSAALAEADPTPTSISTYTSPDGVTYEVATVDVDGYEVVEPGDQSSNEVYEPEPGYVTEEEPPARIQVVVERPVARWSGSSWVDGYWWWDGYTYVWITGHWVRPRANFVFVSPRWDFFGGYWSFVPGYYRPFWALPVYYHSYYHPYYRYWGSRWNQRHYSHRHHGNHHGRRGAHHRNTTRRKNGVNTSHRTSHSVRKRDKVINSRYQRVNKVRTHRRVNTIKTNRRVSIDRNQRVNRRVRSTPKVQGRMPKVQSRTPNRRVTPKIRRQAPIKRATPQVRRSAPIKRVTPKVQGRVHRAKAPKSRQLRSSRKFTRKAPSMSRSRSHRSFSGRSSSMGGRSSRGSVRRSR